MGRLCTALSTVLALWGNVAFGSGLEAVESLESDAPVERSVASGDVHTYRIELADRQIVSLLVKQRGVDVAVTVSDPGGQRLVAVDGPGGRHSPEALLVEATEAGIYRVEVRAPARGSYRIEVEGVDPNSPERLRWLAAQRALTEGAAHCLEGTPEAWRRAIPKYEAVLAYQRDAAQPRPQAWLLYSLGVLYSKVNEVTPALERLHQALAIWRRLGDRQGEADTLHKIGVAHYLRHEYAAAVPFSRQALALRQTLGDVAGQAETLSVLGIIDLYRSEPRKALAFYELAIARARAAGDPGLEAEMLNSTGGVAEVLGEWRQALDYFRRSRELHRSLGERRLEAQALNNMGAVYRTLGEYQAALEHYRQALAIRRDIGDRRGEATSLNSLGRAYLTLGEPEQARSYFQQALPLRRQSVDRRGEAFTLHNLGSASSQLGDPLQALDFYQQALAIRRAIGNRRGEATTLDQIGATHMDLGQLPQARSAFDRALELRRAIGDPSREAMTLRSLAEIHIALDEPAKALEHSRAALELHRSREDRVGTAQTLAVAAQAERLLGDLRSARAHLESSLEIIESLRTRVGSPDLRATYFARERQAYLAYVDLLMELDRRDPSRGLSARALEATERARARSLLDLLGEAGAELRRDLAEPVSAAQIRALLDPDTLLLQYLLGAERSFLWAVTASTVTSFELPVQAVIESSARELYRLWSTLDLFGQDREMQAASDLSRLLLAPVAAQLRDNERLVVIADGALHYVPFAALPLPDGSGQPLLLEHELVSLPSASVLAVQRQTAERTAPRAFAVLADPVFDRRDPRVATSPPGASAGEPTLPRTLPRSPESPSFPRLTSSRREAEAIAALAGDGDVFTALDFAASRATVDSGLLSQYRIVHFATHGVLDSRQPQLSSLVLSLVDEAGLAQDGYLRLSEIYDLELAAEVVVLSGCQTALGREIRGEGLVGLTRGFMYAGAERVLASLWRVQDKATAELMTRFYRSMLHQGRSPAAALRAAQLAIWREKDWQDPYYWAAFVLQGDWR